MKKYCYRIFVIANAIALICACSRELDLSDIPDNSPSHEPEIKELRATIGQFISEDSESDFTTRTTIITDVNDNLQLVWAANDTIGIFPSRGNQVAFPMDGNAGAKTAKFDGGGWGLKSDAAYSAYYPLIGQFYLDRTRIPLDMSSQEQDGNGSFAHVGKRDYMAAINATVNEGGGIDFLFSPLVSLLHMQLMMPEKLDYSRISIEASDNFITAASLNLETGAVTPTKKYPTIELDLKNILFPDEPILDVYLTILPVDLTDKIINVRVYGEGACYSVSLNGKNFVAGTIYNYRKTTSEDPTYTGLPRVIINTPDNAVIDSKEEWIKKSSIIIVNTDGTTNYSSDALQIRGRGNTTWGFPKKPYALKLDSKSEILGMPPHKRWCLLANWMGRTLLRNDVTFHVANCTGLKWTPRGQFVEVVLNGTHIGNYYLCEQIKVDKNRVNIKEMKASDLDGDAITGGYLVELDKNYDEVNKFRSEVMNLPYMFKEPDEDVLQPEQFLWFESFINEMENKLYSEDWLTDREYADYMDLGSFVDWWFVNELAMNA